MINFLAMRLFARVNSTIMWWKIAIPVIAIIFLFFKFHPGNFNPGGGGFMPLGIKAVFGAIPGARIVFSYLASGRPASLPVPPLCPRWRHHRGWTAG
jgi:amino acid transporter